MAINSRGLENEILTFLLIVVYVWVEAVHANH